MCLENALNALEIRKRTPLMPRKIYLIFLFVDYFPMSSPIWARAFYSFRRLYYSLDSLCRLAYRSRHLPLRYMWVVADQSNQLFFDGSFSDFFSDIFSDIGFPCLILSIEDTYWIQTIQSNHEIALADIEFRLMFCVLINLKIISLFKIALINYQFFYVHLSYCLILFVTMFFKETKARSTVATEIQSIKAISS